MRKLPAILAAILFPLTATADSSESYDVYVLACDNGTDCLRVVDVDVNQAGTRAEHVGPGVNLRIDTLAAGPEAATVRLTVNLAPSALAFASLGSRKEAPNARISFQIEPCIIAHDRFAVIATFTGGNKIYQVWGRANPRQRAEIVAAR